MENTILHNTSIQNHKNTKLAFKIIKLQTSIQNRENTKLAFKVMNTQN